MYKYQISQPKKIPKVKNNRNVIRTIQVNHNQDDSVIIELNRKLEDEKKKLQDEVISLTDRLTNLVVILGDEMDLNLELMAEKNSKRYEEETDIEISVPDILPPKPILIQESKFKGIHSTKINNESTVTRKDIKNRIHSPTNISKLRREENVNGTSSNITNKKNSDIRIRSRTQTTKHTKS